MNPSLWKSPSSRATAVSALIWSVTRLSWSSATTRERDEVVERRYRRLDTGNRGSAPLSSR